MTTNRAANRYTLQTADGRFVMLDGNYPGLGIEGTCYYWDTASDAASCLVRCEKHIGAQLTIHGPDAYAIQNATMAARLAQVKAAPLAELPALYERFIGYNPTEDDHDERPSEAMREILIGYLDECMIEESKFEAAAAAKPEGITLNTPNLDHCDDDELRAWAEAFARLAIISNMMLHARELRRDGMIDRAMVREHEARCDYDALPAGVRW
jgi:hypothetical protein